AAATSRAAATPRAAATSRAAITGPQPAETSSALAPPRNKSGRYAALALLVLLLGGGAALMWSRAATKRATSQPSPQPLPAVPSPAPPAPAPKAAVEVILDSTPTGAKIVRDGVVTAETPEALRLTAPTTVIVRKDGFADKSVTLDPQTTHKVIVKLERTHAAKATAGKPTTSAPSTTAAPSRAPAKAAAAATSAKPGEPVDPYANASGNGNGGTSAAAKNPSASATPSPPAATPPRSNDELSGRVEKRGASVVPGGHRLGAIYRGAAAGEGGRSDWFVDLEGGHCYTFVAEGADNVKKLYLYLWGPKGRRLQSAREDSAHAQMSYCTAFSGNYHFQAKVDDGQGEYRVGIYTK
ncbi:MAG: PEGA domain-containing protein, partial [Myxococcales bacterium]|nr:PEGA domain-containing protein [Myxococcales bacterium]